MVRPPVSDNICLRCKGARLLCGKTMCPILMKHSILKSTVPDNLLAKKADGNFFGASPPAIFVGYRGYPKVNIGPLLPLGEFAEEKDTSILNAPESWYGRPMEEIVAYRSGMIRSNFSMGVRYQDNLEETLARVNRNNRKLFEATQELTLANNSVDTEAKLTKVRVSMNYDNHSIPQGPSGRAEEIKVIDNVKVLKSVDKATSDRDLKANEAIFGVLYNSDGVTSTAMQRLLSAGLLGVKKNRRLVPTRWAITAVDDTIGKQLMPKLHNFPEIDKYYTFFGEYLSNKFVILFIPNRWMFEMNECWDPSSIWNQPVEGLFTPQEIEPRIITDFELEKGRTKYAKNITGAYYAARKEVEEFLVRERKQASAIVFREVSGGYIVPLGVWVIRETVKNALAKGWRGPNVQTHETLKSALFRIKTSFQIPMKHWIKASKLLPYLRSQRRLDYWMRK